MLPFVAEVFIQTFRPESPVINLAANVNYQDFYEYIIRKRRKTGFPPFMFIAKIEITMKTEAIVIKKVREAAAILRQDGRLIVSPPIPAFHEHTGKGYGWQIIVRSKSRKAIVESCSKLKGKFCITFDPSGLI